MELPRSAGVALAIVLAVVLAVLLAVAITLLVKLVRMFSLVRSEQMPVQGKLAFWAAIVYTVFPVDVLVDPVYLDDIGVLSAAIAYLGHLVNKYGITRDGAPGAPAEVERAGPADAPGRPGRPQRAEG